jgi:hypothetical protein
MDNQYETRFNLLQSMAKTRGGRQSRNRDDAHASNKLMKQQQQQQQTNHIDLGRRIITKEEKPNLVIFLDHNKK